MAKRTATSQPISDFNLEVTQWLVADLDESPHGYELKAGWRNRRPAITRMRRLTSPLGALVDYDFENLVLRIGPASAEEYLRHIHAFGNHIAMLGRDPLTFERVTAKTGVHIAAAYHHRTVCGVEAIKSAPEKSATCPKCLLTALTPPEGGCVSEYHPFGRVVVSDFELIRLRDAATRSWS